MPRTQAKRRKSPGPPARVERMAGAYAAGATLQAIGDEYSLSRERVRQILRDAGYDLDALKAKARTARRRRISREHGPAIREMLSSGRSPSEVAGALGVALDLVKRIDASDPSYARARRVVRRKAYSLKYMDDELLDCLREANSALGGILTTAAYDEYARGRTLGDGRPWPTHQTAFLRFGSWRSALEQAGLPANAPSPIAGRRLFSEGHCIDAILEVERSVGRLPTVAEYERHAAEMAGVLPSSATIRNRFGSWRRALEAAAEFAHDEPVVSIPR
jgi:Homing endonuclease associated repeat/Sigma-70, region 4